MRIRSIILGVVIIMALLITGCTIASEPSNSYGVFLSIDSSARAKLFDYKEVVIDTQYFSKEDIDLLHKNNVKVYSYINVGSLESFREYYPKYEHLALGDYENWEEEKWIDVSADEWQDFILKLSNELLEKGIDGFFVDNCDVYYNYPSEDIYKSLVKILQNLMKNQKEVIINGGDFFVYKYLDEKGSLNDIMTAVNQETVFTSIDFDNKTFGKRLDNKHYINYVETCKKAGIKVFLLEYTKDEKLIDEIRKYCEEKGFDFYISSSIELG